MNINQKVAALIAAFILTLPAQAETIYLGDAFDFNAYIMEDMYGFNSDVEGALGVGGNLQLSMYGIGLEMPENGAKMPLSIGGDVKIRDSRIYNGHAIAAGTIDIDSSVGLYNDPHTSNTHSFLQGNSYDFAAINEEIRYTSNLWSHFTQNGLTTINSNSSSDIWNITFSGSSLVNVFSISASDLSAANKSIYLDLPTKSYNIINVFGDTVNLFNTGFYGPNGTEIRENLPGEFRNNGAAFNNVLFNFVDATELNMFNVGIKGSILAPFADTNFYNGQINGNFIVKSLSSPENENTGQINDYRFGDFVEVPAPVVFSFFAVLVLYTLFRRKNYTIAIKA